MSNQWLQECQVCHSPGVALLGRSATLTNKHTETTQHNSHECVCIPLMGDPCLCVFWVVICQDAGEVIMQFEQTTAKASW